MIFPIVVKTAAHVEPRASLYYEVAADGLVYQVRNTPIYRAVTRATGPIPGLAPECEHVCLRFPRLPRAQTEDVLAFFAESYDRYQGEAMVVLFYCVETRAFEIGVPPQQLPGRRRRDGSWLAAHAVRYGSVPRPPGCVRLGTIHSHAERPAYTSAADWADEQFEDGLHVVFGSFAGDELSVSAAFVANGARFVLDPGDVLEPYSRPARPARAEWMAQLAIEVEDDDGLSH